MFRVLGMRDWGSEIGGKCIEFGGSGTAVWRVVLGTRGWGQLLLAGGDEVRGSDFCREDKPGREEEREVARQRARKSAYRALSLR